MDLLLQPVMVLLLPVAMVVLVITIHQEPMDISLTIRKQRKKAFLEIV